MRHFHLTRQSYHRPSVNLDKLWTLVSEQTRTKYAADKSGKVPVIDVIQAGYYKVRRSGEEGFPWLSSCVVSGCACWPLRLAEPALVEFCH